MGCEVEPRNFATEIIQRLQIKGLKGFVVDAKITVAHKFFNLLESLGGDTQYGKTNTKLVNINRRELSHKASQAQLGVGVAIRGYSRLGFTIDRSFVRLCSRSRSNGAALTTYKITFSMRAIERSRLIEWIYLRMNGIRFKYLYRVIHQRTYFICKITYWKR